MKSEKKTKPAKKPAARKKMEAKTPAAPPKKISRKAAKAPQALKRAAKPPSPKRKPADIADLSVPPILLEGDEPASPLLGGPGQRFALSPLPVAAPLPPKNGEIELPDSYGTGRLFLTARDPHWLYASWDLASEEQQKLNSLSRDGHLILKVFVNDAAGDAANEVHVHPESRHWFVHVSHGQTKYVCELGCRDRGGQWRSVAVSMPTITPPDRAFDAGTVSFATIPAGVTFQEILESVQAVAGENLQLVEAIREAQTRSERRESLPAPAAPAAPRNSEAETPWISSTPPEIAAPQAAASSASESQQTPAPQPLSDPSDAPFQESNALAKVVRLDPSRRVWIGEVEATELVRRQLAEQVSSASAAEFSRKRGSAGDIAPPAAPNISSPQFGAPGARPVEMPVMPGVSSAIGMESRPRPENSFWFNVNAELVIYGATDPQAAVQIGGRKIRLRPDGSFSFRFILPDGKYELTATAISPDQSEQREARLSFSRQSEYRGEVLAHPQDPALKVPAAENAA